MRTILSYPKSLGWIGNLTLFRQRFPNGEGNRFLMDSQVLYLNFHEMFLKKQ